MGGSLEQLLLIFCHRHGSNLFFTEVETTNQLSTINIRNYMAVYIEYMYLS